MNTQVNFETARLLKEKGFDEYCILKYFSKKPSGYVANWKPDEAYNISGYDGLLLNSKYIDQSVFTYAPTIAEVTMWLYKNYDIWIGVMQRDETANTFFCKISINRTIEDEDISGNKWKSLTVDFLNVGTFNSPTESYSEAINYSLKNLIK